MVLTNMLSCLMGGTQFTFSKKDNGIELMTHIPHQQEDMLVLHK